MYVSMQMTKESVVIPSFTLLPSILLIAVKIQQREETIGWSLILRHQPGRNRSPLTHTYKDPTLRSESLMTPPLDPDDTILLGGQWSTIMAVVCNTAMCRDKAVMTCLLAQ
jgi:hypothetical protein